MSLVLESVLLLHCVLLPFFHKHSWFLAQLCFPPSWQKPWLWSVGIKLGICCSQFLFCCWNSHLCEITAEKCFYLWCFIYFLFLWHVLQKCKNPPLFFRVYPARSQETVWLCVCSRWRSEGSVGSRSLPSVKHVGALPFHVWLCRYLSKTVSYRGLQVFSAFSCWDAGMEMFAGCSPLRLVLCPCAAQLSNSWLPVKLWNVEQLQTHHVPLSAGTIGHWTELLILNYSVCADNDHPGAIIRYKKGSETNL